MRFLIKVVLVVMLWYLVVKPLYLTIRDKAEDTNQIVKKFYWWMSPGKDGWPRK